MPSYIQKSTGGDFTPTPAGVHQMICKDVIDLGTQPGSDMYPTPRRKIMIRWEVTGERVEIDGKDLPMLHSEKYTWSFHENANLRQMLESWRGKKFTEEDFSGPPNGFSVKNLIGVPMMGQVFHDEKGDKTYANLKTAMPTGQKREDWPSLEGEAIYLDLDEFDPDAFSRLPDYQKGLIEASPEYKEIHANVLNNPSENPGHDMEDEIPF